MTYLKKLILSIVAMFVGGMIYVLWRDDSLVMFTWFDGLGLRDHIATLRAYAHILSHVLPRPVYDCFPQALWLFSGIVGFNCIWTHSAPLNELMWSLAFSAIAFGFEVGQYIGIVPGRFDILDLVSLLVAFLAARLLIHFSDFQEGKVYT